MQRALPHTHVRFNGYANIRYIEDLNDLVDVADQLQLDESVFDSLAAEMDYFDDNDISELAQEFDTIPEEEKKALFGE
jgi:hypothetical protein